MSKLMNGPIWVAAMGWHLWRILTARPAYQKLSDTPLTLMSFLSVFLFAGVLRWTILGSSSLIESAANLTIQGLLLTLLALRRHRSSSLLSAYLGVSAGVDLVVAAAYVTTAIPTVHLYGNSNLALQVVLMAMAYIQFRREPEPVRATGYRASSHPAP